MVNLIYSIISLFLSGIANFGSSVILSHYNLNQQPANDILLHNIPRIAWMGYVADTIIILMTILLFYSFRRNLAKISFSLYSFSAIFFVRSILVLLTPINNSYGVVEYWDLFSIGSYPSGMFPSGHTAYAFLCFLLFQANTNKKYYRLSLFLLVGEIIALISSHGHYSIDIIGGLMLAYIVYRLGLDYQKKLKF